MCLATIKQLYLFVCLFIMFKIYLEKKMKFFRAISGNEKNTEAEIG